MCVAEFVAELTYGEAGLSIEEVMSLNVYQTRAVLLRRRDKYGKLIRVNSGVPEHVLQSTDSEGNRRVYKRVPLAEAYIRARMNANNLTREQATERWRSYVKKLQDERAELNAAKRNRKAQARANK